MTFSCCFKTIERTFFSESPLLCLIVSFISSFLSSFRSFQHDGKNPSTFAEKEEFKSFIKSQARDYHNEVNYQEAVREYYRGYAKKTLSDALVDLVQAQREEKGYRLTSQSSEFE